MVVLQIIGMKYIYIDKNCADFKQIFFGKMYIRFEYFELITHCKIHRASRYYSLRLITINTDNDGTHVDCSSRREHSLLFQETL